MEKVHFIHPRESTDISDQPLPICRESQVIQGRPYVANRKQLLIRREMPEFQGAVVTGRRQAEAIRREGK